MPAVSNQEWLNQNSLRNYPFKEDMLLIPTSSGILLTDVRIPNYLVVDLIITVPGDTTPRLYLSQLGLIGNLITFVFTDEADIQVATLSVDLNTHTKNKAYNLVGAGTYDDVRGMVVLGDLTRLTQDLAEGLYTFTLNTTEFENSTVRPAIRGVRSLQLLNGGAESGYIYGHVKLIAGSNIRLTYLPDYNGIRVDAISGNGLNEECECPSGVGERNIVRTINGKAIEFAEIVGDGQCIEVKVNGNKIVISDICSTPCCGCPELEFVTESLKTLEASIDNLENYANQLAERISNFVTSFVLTIGAGS